MTAERLRLVLHAIGYPVAIVVIARLKAVVRERRTAWFWAEEAGTAAIVAGWALVGRWPAVVVNAVWGVGLALFWHRRRPPRPARPDPATTTRP